MTLNAPRTQLLRELKNYLLLLRNAGYTHIPLKTGLIDQPVLNLNTTEIQLDMASRAKSPPSSKSQPVKSQTMSSELKQVQDELGDCTRCKLCETRKNIVFGSGNPHADLVFVGEGPGADEDEQGLPFVGRAGRKLTDIIEKGMKLDRQKDTYICNIVKCRPPGNRDPERDEVDACKPFLIKQLLAIRPKVIVALGKPAASTLLGRTVLITKERGTWHDFEGIPLMLTLHPAYLLRAYTLENRRAVMDDMNKVLEALKK